MGYLYSLLPIAHALLWGPADALQWEKSEGFWFKLKTIKTGWLFILLKTLWGSRSLWQTSEFCDRYRSVWKLRSVPLCFICRLIPTPPHCQHYQFTYLRGSLWGLSACFDPTPTVLTDNHMNHKILTACRHVLTPIPHLLPTITHEIHMCRHVRIFLQQPHQHVGICLSPPVYISSIRNLPIW